MYDTVFYQKFLNTPFGFAVLFLTGMGLVILECWWFCKRVDKQKMK